MLYHLSFIVCSVSVRQVPSSSCSVLIIYLLLWESGVLAKFYTPCQHKVAYPSVLPLPPEHGVGLLVREKLAPLVPEKIITFDITDISDNRLFYFASSISSGTALMLLTPLRKTTKTLLAPHLEYARRD